MTECPILQAQASLQPCWTADVSRGLPRPNLVARDDPVKRLHLLSWGCVSLADGSRRLGAAALSVASSVRGDASRRLVLPTGLSTAPWEDCRGPVGQMSTSSQRRGALLDRPKAAQLCSSSLNLDRFRIECKTVSYARRTETLNLVTLPWLKGHMSSRSLSNASTLHVP